MKLRNVSAGIVLCLTMVSCIQDEALNVEAAIDGCSGTNIQLSTRPLERFSLLLIKFIKFMVIGTSIY